MDLEHFEDFKKFEEFFCPRKDSGKKKEVTPLALLIRASDFIEKLNSSGLVEVIHYFYNAWPHCRTRSGLVRGAKRAVQARFYEEFYDREPSKKVLKADLAAKEELDLRDEKYVAPIPTGFKKGKVKMNKKEPKPPKPKKPEKPKTIFAIKVAEMDIGALIDWAKELGVLQEKIDKHKNKSLGLAKMNISNLIRGALRQKGTYDEFDRFP
jgi:hypothetical protein